VRIRERKIGKATFIVSSSFNTAKEKHRELTSHPAHWATGFQ